jgi:hypothetical protein
MDASEAMPVDPVVPPRRIGGATVLLFSPIDGRHRPTGGLEHVGAGVRQGPAARIAICHDEGDDCFYLFGCNERWESITDTWHQSLEEAMQQAEVEYVGVSKTWQRAC